MKNGDFSVQQYIDSVAKELGDEIKVTDFARIALGD